MKTTRYLFLICLASVFSLTLGPKSLAQSPNFNDSVERFFHALRDNDFPTIYKFDYDWQNAVRRIKRDEPQFLQDKRITEHFQTASNALFSISHYITPDHYFKVKRYRFLSWFAKLDAIVIGGVPPYVEHFSIQPGTNASYLTVQDSIGANQTVAFNVSSNAGHSFFFPFPLAENWIYEAWGWQDEVWPTRTAQHFRIVIGDAPQNLPTQVTTGISQRPTMKEERPLTAVVDPSAVALTSVCPKGQLGEFRHGTKCTAYYNENQLVDIQVVGKASSKDYVSTKNLVHPGVDLVAEDGSEVFPIADGTVDDVISSDKDPNFKSLGYMVIVEHKNKSGGKPTYSIYLHLNDKPAVAVGDPVIAGKTLLGRVGTTGAAFGPHLHLEIRHFAGRLSEKWKNIYGVERPSNLAAFDQADFAANWSDPEGFGRVNPGHSSPAERTFETLKVGAVIYTKVTVLNKNATIVFIKHARGLTSINVKDLTVDEKKKLGYGSSGPDNP